jgi:biopolymer transport protein TolR
MGASFSPMPRRKGARKRSLSPTCTVNVIPLVDVMLVLLIIFMVAAPMMTVGVPVNLPKTQGSATASEHEPIVVTYDAQGRVFLQETQLDLGALTPRLLAITQNNKDAPIYLRGDKDLPYGKVMALMGQLAEGGFSHVSLIGDGSESKSKNK